MEEKNSPIDVILDKFVEYVRASIQKNGGEGKSAYQYRQVINAFEVDGAFVPENTNKEDVIKANVSKNFLELVPKFIINPEVTVNDRKYTITEIIKVVQDFKDSYNWVQNHKKSYKTYLDLFLKFINDVCNPDNNDKYKDIFDACANERFSSSDFAILNGKTGDVYLHNKLATKFKSRLRCQDRTSGDKIWLPLRFIAKIYSKDKRNFDDDPDNKEKNEKKDNQFSKWLDMLVNDIYIHYVENGKVENVRFGEKDGKKDVHLRLSKHRKKGQTVNEYKVYVRWINENGKVIEKQVLTPTGKGNMKECMKVRDISEIAIDHVKSIDRTLRDLSDDKNNKLKELIKVSDKYKEIQAEDEPDEDIAVDELLESELDLEELRKELDFIKDDGLLRLMASKYNSQKSNGDTFKEIRKITHDKYIGIIEEDIKMENYPNGDSMTLYQELTDVLDQTGNLSIAYSNSASLTGTSVDKIKGFKLEKIINRI